MDAEEGCLLISEGLQKLFTTLIPFWNDYNMSYVEFRVQNTNWSRLLVAFQKHLVLLEVPLLLIRSRSCTFCNPGFCRIAVMFLLEPQILRPSLRLFLLRLFYVFKPLLGIPKGPSTS